MPYGRRRTYRRRSYRRRRRAPTRGAVYGRAASQLWKDVKTLKNFVNTEFKNTQGYLNSTVNTSGQMILMNGLASGDNETNREGDAVRFKSIQITARYGLGSAPVPSVVRAIVFIDLQTDSATPLISDLLDLATASPVTALRSLNHRRRFLILKDKTYPMSPNGREVAMMEWYRKIDVKTFYTSTASLIADIQAMPIYLLLVADQSSTNSPTVDLFYRLRYIDN